MRAAGLPRAYIWNEAERFFDPSDRQWKLEIPDEAARLSVKGQLVHPKLFRAHPELKGSKIHYVDVSDPFGGSSQYRGYYNPETKQVGLSKDLDPEQALSTAIHEYSHGVQRESGFAPGGSMADKDIRAMAEEAVARKRSKAAATMERARAEGDMETFNKAFEEHYLLSQPYTQTQEAYKASAIPGQVLINLLKISDILF